MSRHLFAVLAFAVALGTLPADPPPKPEADKELQAIRERVQTALDDLRGKAAFPPG